MRVRSDNHRADPGQGGQRTRQAYRGDSHGECRAGVGIEFGGPAATSRAKQNGQRQNAKQSAIRSDQARAQVRGQAGPRVGRLFAPVRRGGAGSSCLAWSGAGRAVGCREGLSVSLTRSWLPAVVCACSQQRRQSRPRRPRKAPPAHCSRATLELLSSYCPRLRQGPLRASSRALTAPWPVSTLALLAHRRG